MTIDDLRPAIDWGKYQTLTLERRDNGVLLMWSAKPLWSPACDSGGPRRRPLRGLTFTAEL
jgi:hypothetical protein